MSNIVDIYPLSPMQMGMLFHSLLEPERHLYHEQLVFKVKGELEPTLFKQSWEKVISNNEVLRTVFDYEDDPIQIVINDQSLDFEELDATSHNYKEVITRILQKDLKKGFDLQKGPLIRLKSVKLNGKTSFIMMSYHHMIIDGSSIPLLLEELRKYYMELSTKKQIDFVFRTPYKEYIRWLSSQKTIEAQKYWKDYLDNYSGTNSILAEEHSKTLVGSQVARIKKVFPIEISKSIRNISLKSHITVSNILQAVWALTLRDITHADQVVFGSTVYGRPPELHLSNDMVGLFINTLPMLVRFETNESVISIAKRLQYDWASMQEHSFLSLSEIKKLMPSKTTSDPFDSIFVFTDQSLVGEKSPFLEFEVYEYRELTNYTYTVDANWNEELEIQLSYPSRLVNSRDAQIVIKTYEHYLDVLLNSPNTKLSFETEKIGDPNLFTNNTDFDFTVSKDDKSKFLSQIENDIKEVWREVLGLNDISSTVNFFEIGGDSISCLRIVSKLLQKNYATSLKEVFENPTIKELSQSIQESSHSNAKKITSYNFSPENMNRITEKHGNNVEKILPLSYVQKSILEDCIKGKSYLYHDQSSFEYEGKIDYRLFEETWNQVVKENSVLRSTFFFNDNEPVSVIIKNKRLKLQIHDLTEFTGDTQIKKIDEFIREDLSNEFNIEDQPPLRISLIKLSPNRHIFLFSFSVLLIDGWCFAFVLNDFYQHYKSGIKKTSPLKIKRPQYEEYLKWLKSKNLEQAISYWKKYLKDLEPVQYIKRLKTKDSIEQYTVDSQSLTLPSELVKKLETVARKNRITLNTLFQTSWAAVLRHASFHKDIVIGTTVSGRHPDLPGSDQMIGLFFNDIPVRFSLPDIETNTILNEAVKVQNSFSRSSEFDYVALTQLKKIMNISESEEIFQTLFIFENYPKHEQSELQSNKKEFLKEVTNWRREASTIDINVYVEIGDISTIEIRYLSELFSKKKIDELLLFYRKILKNLAK